MRAPFNRMLATGLRMTRLTRTTPVSDEPVRPPRLPMTPNDIIEGFRASLRASVDLCDVCHNGVEASPESGDSDSEPGPTMSMSAEGGPNV